MSNATDGPLSSAGVPKVGSFINNIPLPGPLFPGINFQYPPQPSDAALGSSFQIGTDVIPLTKSRDQADETSPVTQAPTVATVPLRFAEGDDEHSLRDYSLVFVEIVKNKSAVTTNRSRLFTLSKLNAHLYENRSDPMHKSEESILNRYWLCGVVDKSTEAASQIDHSIKIDGPFTIVATMGPTKVFDVWSGCRPAYEAKSEVQHASLILRKVKISGAVEYAQREATARDKFALNALSNTSVESPSTIQAVLTDLKRKRIDGTETSTSRQSDEYFQFQPFISDSCVEPSEQLDDSLENGYSGAIIRVGATMGPHQASNVEDVKQYINHKSVFTGANTRGLQPIQMYIHPRVSVV